MRSLSRRSSRSTHFLLRVRWIDLPTVITVLSQVRRKVHCELSVECLHILRRRKNSDCDLSRRLVLSLSLFGQRGTRDDDPKLPQRKLGREQYGRRGRLWYERIMKCDRQLHPKTTSASCAGRSSPLPLSSNLTLLISEIFRSHQGTYVSINNIFFSTSVKYTEGVEFV